MSRAIPVVLAAALLAGPAAVAAPGSPSGSPAPSPTATSGAADQSSPGSQAQDPSSDDSAHATFGIGPAHDVPASQTLDGRPYLNYLATPGATVLDSVAVLNLADEPVTLRVYPTDAEQGEDGAFGLLPEGDKPADAGSWIKLKLPKSGKVTVPARQGNTYGRVLVPVQVRIPQDATPGDHVGGIIASLQAVSTDKKGTRIRLDQRIGLRTYFRIAGPLKPKLAIENLRASYHAKRDPRGRGTVTASYTVHNTGNVRMNASQIVRLDRTFGSVITRYPASLNDILPGSRVRVTTRLDGVVGLGKLTATATIFPTPTDPTVPSTRGFVQKKVTFWAVSWWLLGAIALLLLLLLGGGFWWWRGWRRKKRLKLGAGGTNAPQGGGRRAARGKQPVLQRRLGEARAERRVPRMLFTILVTAIGTTVLVASPADAASTPSPWQIYTETNTKKNDPQGGYSGDQANAIIDGWWGHEDPKSGPTLFSVADYNSPDFFKAFGVPKDDYSHIGVAFVPASADGSTEHPQVHQGERAGQAFTWFTLMGAFGSWTQSIAGADSVGTVSTQAEWDDWVAAGSPLVDYNDKLQPMLPLVEGNPLTQHASGASVLNRWPAGQKISMVYFTIADWDSHSEPIVKVGPDGHAITAWMRFETVASPSQPMLKTSAGYKVLDVPAGFGVNTIARVNGKPIPKPASSASADASAAASAGVSPGASSRAGETATADASSAGQPATADRSSHRGGLAGHGSAVAGGVVLTLLVLGAVLMALRGSRRSSAAKADDPNSTSNSDRSLTGR